MSFARTGDTLVVWKLDRFGRSLSHLIEGVHQLQARGVGFRSLQESIDTTTSGGKLVFHLFGALAEFERDLIRERTRAGLTAARARGRKGGRPRVLDDKKLTLARSLLTDRNNSPAAIAAMLGVSRAMVYRYAGPSRPTVPTRPTPVIRASARGVQAKPRKPATGARAKTYA